VLWEPLCVWRPVNCLPGMAERFWRGSSKLCQGARARDSGDLRSALTEFAPALRCHYPGQA
jgi:hypothetical protein